MVDPKSIRIGNLVLIDGKAQEVEAIIMLCNGFALYVEGIDYDYSLYAEPIQLTEEWLLKFGFEDKGNFFEYTNNLTFKLWQPILKLGSEEVYWLPNIVDCRLELQYVHQLQNLYFALTSEDLTIKEKAQ